MCKHDATQKQITKLSSYLLTTPLVTLVGGAGGAKEFDKH